MRADYAKNQPADWLAVFQRALRLSTSIDSAELLAVLEHLLLSEASISTFRNLVVSRSRDTYDQTGLQSVKLSSHLTTIINRLVDPSIDGSPYQEREDQHALRVSILATEDSLESRIAKAVQSADDLSLPFCQIQLRLLFGGLGEKSSEGQSSHNRLVRAFCNEFERQESLATTTLVDLVGFLSDDAAGEVLFP